MGISAEGSTAIVFGASGILGSAVVKAFRQKSWRVAGTGHHNAPNADFSFQFDATRRDEVRRLEEWMRSNLPHVDAAVHCIGITRDATLPHIEPAAWQEVLNTNLKSAYLLSQVLIKRWVKQEHSHLILVSSWGGIAGRHGQSSYSAAKAGLIGLTQSLAREYASRGIRINAIIPGVFPSPLAQNLPPEKLQRLWAGAALSQFADLDETAAFIAHLASMRSVTGQTFHLDGRIPSVLG